MGESNEGVVCSAEGAMGLHCNRRTVRKAPFIWHKKLIEQDFNSFCHPVGHIGVGCQALTGDLHFQPLRHVDALLFAALEDIGWQLGFDSVVGLPHHSISAAVALLVERICVFDTRHPSAHDDAAKALINN